jgi:hypothetical protein
MEICGCNNAIAHGCLAELEARVTSTQVHHLIITRGLAYRSNACQGIICQFQAPTYETDFVVLATKQFRGQRLHLLPLSFCGLFHLFWIGINLYRFGVRL